MDFFSGATKEHKRRLQVNIHINVMVPLVIFLCLLLGSCQIHGQSNFRIINGSAAKPKQLPYQVALYSYFGVEKEPSACGGTIISKRWILTAAHCLQEPDAVLNRVLVIVGTINKKNKTEPGHVQLVVTNKKDIVVHHKYDHNTVANDIGLLKLPKDLRFNVYAKAAKLPKRRDKKMFIGRRAISSGWGLTENGQSSDILQFAIVKIISNRQCEKQWNKHLINERKLILDSFLCIDSKDGLPCLGDSGGPLILDDDSLTLVGVVSHGYDEKCQTRLPDIFTRVSSFIDWIEKHTGRLNRN